MLSCKELTERATEYLEGDVSFGERLMFRMHLAMCKHCRNYVEQIRLTAEALGLMDTDEPLNPEMKSELMAAFREASEGTTGSHEPVTG